MTMEVALEQYEYKITVHDADDILAVMSERPLGQAPPKVYCDEGGECFLDAADNPYAQAVVDLFNGFGEEGWALLQVTPRQRDMICFWRRPRISKG